MNRVTSQAISYAKRVAFGPLLAQGRTQEALNHGLPAGHPTGAVVYAGGRASALAALAASGALDTEGYGRDGQSGHLRRGRRREHRERSESWQD